MDYLDRIKDGEVTGKAVAKRRKVVAKKTPNIPQFRDLFQTPNYAVDLLIPFIPKEIKVIWEPAAGDNRIVSRLERNGYLLLATDIRFDHYLHDEHFNFVEGDDPGFDFDCIITNPPFSIKDTFIDKAVRNYGHKPFAFLVNADYSRNHIKWILEYGCEKIIPSRRVNFVTPNIVNRINRGEGTSFVHLTEVPSILLYKYSSAQFHSMWLTRGFNLGRSETFVDTDIAYMKENM